MVGAEWDGGVPSGMVGWITSLERKLAGYPGQPSWPFLWMWKCSLPGNNLTSFRVPTCKPQIQSCSLSTQYRSLLEKVGCQLLKMPREKGTRTQGISMPQLHFWVLGVPSDGPLCLSIHNTSTLSGDFRPSHPVESFLWSSVQGQLL